MRDANTCAPGRRSWRCRIASTCSRGGCFSYRYGNPCIYRYPYMLDERCVAPETMPTGADPSRLERDSAALLFQPMPMRKAIERADRELARLHVKVDRLNGRGARVEMVRDHSDDTDEPDGAA